MPNPVVRTPINMRCWACALLGMLLAWVLAAPAAGHQPPPVHEVGDHWSAWDPPTSFGEGAEIYVIKRGDTLWDLANQWFGTPYLWPQIWERNSYILDSHWIYPGDPLEIGVDVTPVDTLAQIGAETAQTEMRSPWDTRLESPKPLGSESDIYCSGYIGPDGERLPHAIIGTEYQALAPMLGTTQTGRPTTVKIGLSSGDIVYTDGGANAGMVPGMVFSVVQPEERVRHPRTGELLGRFYSYTGRVRIIAVQADTTIAEVTLSCAPIESGALLKPFEPEPIPLARRTPLRGSNDPASAAELADSGVIVRAKDHLVSLGQDHVVWVSLGESDEAAPGDLFTIYRENRPGLPPLVVGELALLSVKEHSSVAMILQSRHTVLVGDQLQLK